MDTNQKQSALTIDKKPAEAEKDLGANAAGSHVALAWSIDATTQALEESARRMHVYRRENEDSMMGTSYMHVNCPILAPCRGPAKK
jgi:hypothetical protein